MRDTVDSCVLDPNKFMLVNTANKIIAGREKYLFIASFYLNWKIIANLQLLLPNREQNCHFAPLLRVLHVYVAVK